MTAVSAVATEEFDERLRVEGLVVVDFWADWCSPCHAMKPALEQFATEEAATATVLSVDTVTHPELAERFGVISLPTLLLFREGELVHRTTGVKRLPQLRRLLAEHVGGVMES